VSRIAIDYEEVLWAGLELSYQGRELYEAAFQMVEDLKHWQGGEVRRHLLARLSGIEAGACREQGMCPHCGRELEEGAEGFAVDGGAKAYHSYTVLMCPACDL